MKSIKIANVQGFWGDSPDAAYEMLLAEDVDVLTLDYLAEVSLSIMAIQKEKNPDWGYARDFLSMIDSVLPFYQKGKNFKIVSNAGGLNPLGLAKECLKKIKGTGLKIGVVTGDDVLVSLLEDKENSSYDHLDQKKPLSLLGKPLKTANAYLGSQEIAKALDLGADIVITGRVADPCLVVGTCLSFFSWSLNDYKKIAQATIAGHLIECGRQVVGGISSFWNELQEQDKMGFPIVDIHENGTFILSKPCCHSGEVSLRTVKEQLLYEIGDPKKYISPDVIVSLESLRLEEVAPNKVMINGAIGKAPTRFYKVNATYQAGYKSEGFLTIYGRDAVEKAERCALIIKKRLAHLNMLPQEFYYECLGSGAVGTSLSKGKDRSRECVLRVAVADEQQAPLAAFSKELAPLVTYGPQGVTGYASARPKPLMRFGYWPCLIAKEKVKTNVMILEDLL